MTYRANGSYLKFRTDIKTSIPLTAADKSMNTLLAKNKSKIHLHDEPAVTANQNVYDSIIE